jgi:hypothetical protein
MWIHISPGTMFVGHNVTDFFQQPASNHIVSSTCSCDEVVTHSLLFPSVKQSLCALWLKLDNYTYETKQHLHACAWAHAHARTHAGVRTDARASTDTYINIQTCPHTCSHMRKCSFNKLTTTRAKLEFKHPFCCMALKHAEKYRLLKWGCGNSGKVHT